MSKKLESDLDPNLRRTNSSNSPENVEEYLSQNKISSESPVETFSLQHSIIFHDFKNLLMSIQGELSLLRQEIDPLAAGVEKLDRIESRIQYGNTLIRRFLGRARKDHRRNNTIDLNTLIEHALRVIRQDSKNIVVRCNPASDGAYVDADSGQVELVFLNLLDNAVDAMPYGGKLTVSTRWVERDTVAHQWQCLTQNAYIEMTVADTGVGMDPKIKDRIFEPFYTTKSKSKGSGLGLTSVQEVVADLSGHINVRSQKGIGTSIKVLFPVAQNMSAKKKREDPRR